MRPRQLHHYQAETSPAQLAAAYACSLARNHGFVDGNKRTAFLTTAGNSMGPSRR
ncbi:MAG TPA: Fic family protein [Terriglobia bacterium]